MSTAVTEGVRISVSSLYLPHQSAPDEGRFAFAYTVLIRNDGEKTAQLRTRHWVITDGRGKIEEVRGEGVIGEKPILRPGQEFLYTSGCVLATPRGTMHGSYQMHREDGSTFDATISPFVLARPGAEVERVLN